MEVPEAMALSLSKLLGSLVSSYIILVRKPSSLRPNTRVQLMVSEPPVHLPEQRTSRQPGSREKRRRRVAPGTTSFLSPHPNIPPQHEFIKRLSCSLFQSPEKPPRSFPPREALTDTPGGVLYQSPRRLFLQFILGKIFTLKKKKKRARSMASC